MAFIDEIHVHIKAGAGGDGVVRWLRLKYTPRGGPAGGDGGRGGDVYIRGVRDSAILERYRFTKEFVAEDGEHGRSRSQKGADGSDLVIDVPLGCIVTNTSTGKQYEILEEDKKVKILSGGRGGLGNEYFKGAENQRPQEHTKGKPGEEADFSIELQLIADAGLAGFPNAGKSYLLNELTGASSKVGGYHFTTLDPHLGDLFGYIIADIPGLIEGASHGKGLGHKFLKHISRTSLIIHCISLEHDDIEKRFNIVRDELKTYNPLLTQKPFIIILTKHDVVDEKVRRQRVQEMQVYDVPVYTVSVLDDVSIKELRDMLVKHLRDITNIQYDN